MNNSPPFTILFGPTASGKTALAYALAEETGADLLSFDSRHVYKGMDIVTGKDLPRPDAPFALLGVDLISPDDEFSIRHYYEYAEPILERYREQGKPLILVGGSWQYASVLLAPPPSLLALRDYDLRQERESLTVEELQSQVQTKNPERWSEMNVSDRANPRRLIRILEHDVTAEKVLPPLLETNEYRLEILNPEMELVEERIHARIEDRLAHGALTETKKLMELYPDWSFPAFSSTGYRILRRHIEGELTLEETKQLWFYQERKYAKRQKTWIKKIQTTLAQ